MASSDRLPPVEPFDVMEGQITNETKTDPVQELSEIMKRVTVQNDMDRIRSATQLVNVFNFAIQVQAGRVQWQPSDYRAFAIALSALDSIGQVETEIENELARFQGNRKS